MPAKTLDADSLHALVERRQRWAENAVASMFYGRSGHGGGPCTYRVLRPNQLRTILENAYQAGVEATLNDEAHGQARRGQPSTGEARERRAS